MYKLICNCEKMYSFKCPFIKMIVNNLTLYKIYKSTLITFEEMFRMTSLKQKILLKGTSFVLVSFNKVTIIQK